MRVSEVAGKMCRQITGEEVVRTASGPLITSEKAST